MNLFGNRKKPQSSKGAGESMKQVSRHLNQMMTEMPHEIVETHKHSTANKMELEKSKLCGCFYCLEVFLASEVSEWVDGGNTALCPKCGIDSVLGDATCNLDAAFLKEMHKYWFR